MARPWGFVFMAPLRAGFYIDGFNVYGAICELGDEHLKWMSYRSLCEWMARSPWIISGERLESAMSVEFIKLYTAVPSHDDSRANRHREFLAACTAEGVAVHEGSFKSRVITCRGCGDSWIKREEKESDVHLAVDIVADAIRGLIDVAYVLTCDSDIAPAFRVVRESTAVKLISVAFEPRRHSKELKAEAHGLLFVRARNLRRSLLPKLIMGNENRIMATRPSKYNPPA